MSISCSICTEILTGRVNETVSTTKCGHVFHRSCIFQWIERSETCPICRQVQTMNSIIALDLSIIEADTVDEAQLEEIRKIAIEDFEENEKLELEYRRLEDVSRRLEEMDRKIKEDEYRRCQKLCVQTRTLLDEIRKLLDRCQRRGKEILRLKINKRVATQ